MKKKYVVLIILLMHLFGKNLYAQPYWVQTLNRNNYRLINKISAIVKLDDSSINRYKKTCNEFTVELSEKKSTIKKNSISEYLICPNISDSLLPKNIFLYIKCNNTLIDSIEIRIIKLPEHNLDVFPKFLGYVNGKRSIRKCIDSFHISFTYYLNTIYHDKYVYVKSAKFYIGASSTKTSLLKYDLSSNYFSNEQKKKISEVIKNNKEKKLYFIFSDVIVSDGECLDSYIELMGQPI